MPLSRKHISDCWVGKKTKMQGAPGSCFSANTEQSDGMSKMKNASAL